MVSLVERMTAKKASDQSSEEAAEEAEEHFALLRLDEPGLGRKMARIESFTSFYENSDLSLKFGAWFGVLAGLDRLLSGFVLGPFLGPLAVFLLVFLQGRRTLAKLYGLPPRSFGTEAKNALRFLGSGLVLGFWGLFLLGLAGSPTVGWLLLTSIAGVFAIEFLREETSLSAALSRSLHQLLRVPRALLQGRDQRIATVHLLFFLPLMAVGLCVGAAFAGVSWYALAAFLSPILPKLALHVAQATWIFGVTASVVQSQLASTLTLMVVSGFLSPRQELRGAPEAPALPELAPEADQKGQSQGTPGEMDP